MATLAEIRAKLLEAQNKSSGQLSGGGDNAIYPHWNMQEDKEAVIRFLPDGDESNTFFWVERQMIKLPFSGIKGDPTSRPVIVQVPCVEMYGDGAVCPILTEVRAWFKDKSLEELGRKYWKKKSYIFQGFVTEDALNEENPPENPIRRFIIGPQIYQIIRSALMDPELDESPTHYLKGIDFRIAKSSKGGFADYSVSKWSRRERALSDAEQDAIAKYKLFNLAEFLPKRPTDADLKVMVEMFEASVDGEAYDQERWGQFFKPAGLSSATGDPNKSTRAQPATVKTVELDDADEVAPWEAPAVSAPATTPAPSQSAKNAQDIMAMIRNRK